MSGDHFEAGGDINVGGDVAGRDIIKTTYVHESLTPPTLSLHQLPPPPQDFTGRVLELSKLSAALQEEHARILGLWGQGGVGKTTLALVLADQLKQQYPDAQLFIDLHGASDQPLSTASAMAYVIRGFRGFETRLPENDAEIRGLYLSVLYQKRALLILDNAKDAAQIEPLIPPPTCLLLITSRQRFTLPGLHMTNLREMPPNDARALLVRIAPKKLNPDTESSTPEAGDANLSLLLEKLGVEPEASDKIARMCGYLPLGLRLAASLLTEHQDLTPLDLIRRLQDVQTRMKLTGTAVALQTSYDLLTEELQARWRTLAVFQDHSFDVSAAMAVWDVNRDKAEDILTELVNCSLVNRGEGKTLVMGMHSSLVLDTQHKLHELARLFAISRLSDAEHMVAQQRYARHYLAVLANANHLCTQGRDIPRLGVFLYQWERENIQTGRAWAWANATTLNEAAEWCCGYASCGAVLELCEHPRKHIQWEEGALAAARHLKRQDLEANHLSGLGRLHFRLGELEKAVACFEQALKIDEETGQRLNEVDINNLGMVYTRMGEFKKAIEAYEKASILAREAGDPGIEADSIGNLGTVYMSLGEDKKAISYYKQAFFLHRKRSDKIGEGGMLCNLGVVYSHLGKHQRAVAYFKRALKRLEWFSKHEFLGNTHLHLGAALVSLGDKPEAIAHIKAALNIYESIEHPGAELARVALATLQNVEHI